MNSTTGTSGMPASASAPLRLAFVGCGGIATAQHAPAYQKLPDVRIVAACDVLPEKAAQFAARFDCQPYTDYQAMLREQRPDVVDVCTREHQHVEPVVDALESGADVLCEKIMAHTLEGGRAMVAAAERNGRLLGVDYNYRFFPIFARMQQMLAAGDLGEIALMTVAAHAFCFHHAIDLVRWLGASGGAGDVAAVSGHYTATADPKYHFQVQCPDFVYVPSRNAALTLRFASSALATITASRFEDLRASMLRVDVTGERGRLTADGITTANIMGRLTHVALGSGAPAGRSTVETLSYYDGDDTGFNVAFERSLAAFIARVRARRTPTGDQSAPRTDAAIADASSAAPDTAPAGAPSTYADAATTASAMSPPLDPNPSATGEDGLSVLRIERAFVLAHEQGRTIPLSDV